ncbi:hypothetical protein PACTADRAFT_47561 [Pachysolen tannophilus NRRL Y-2460]|uniref:DNA helicase n=1 Tax=Pachysolen tannophilus NRRL Y-2460 TaxID=669874 RepID=A0A1E4U121_PACTA|nr:hypothetical protein PACTADRAFT_47561 [Pachysolen tannophilus NRRL Y-2460]
MSNIRLGDLFLESIHAEEVADYVQTAQLLSTLPPKALQQKGLAILNLSISNVRSGLSDKTIIELRKHANVITDGNESIENVDSIKIGDIVKIDKFSKNVGSSDDHKLKKKLKNSSNNKDKDSFENENEVEINGVVTKITSSQINVTLNEDSSHLAGSSSKVEDKLMKLYSSSDTKIWLVKLSNSITYKRMQSTMRKLKELEVHSSTKLVKILLGELQYDPPSEGTLTENLKTLKFFNEHLNESQKNAVNFSLLSDLTIVHGPFGTGKTSTIIEIIKQLLITKKSNRILVCGPSNISVDTILERLDGDFLNRGELIRIGHPARLLTTNLKYSLDLISRDSDQGMILKDVMDEINLNIRNLKKCKRSRERSEIYQNLKILRKDLKLRSKKVLNELILNSKVVVSTLHGAGSRELTSVELPNPSIPLFDTVIIDEVSQSLEPQCWIPIINHKNVQKLIIAGDNKQLSPTIKIENESSKNFKNLNMTLFDRLLKNYNGEENAKFLKFLNVQYRMNAKICYFPSYQLYNNLLQTDESCKDNLLTNLNGKILSNDDTTEAIIWYDTQGECFPERDLSQDSGEVSSSTLVSSKYNENEILVVLKHVSSLLASNVQQSDIGIISPYNAQVSFLKKVIYYKKNWKDIEISTVDGFQGREKEVIILSLVRSNSEQKIGFLKDFKRLNVSITRCKRQLCVIGDMELFQRCNNDFLKKWSQWCENNVDVRYPDLGDLLEEFGKDLEND